MNIRFHLETSKGNRICWLCDNPIKKGEKCLTTSVETRYGYTHIHIHLYHLNDEFIKQLVVNNL